MSELREKLRKGLEGVTPGPWVSVSDDMEPDELHITTDDRLYRNLIPIAVLGIGYNDPIETEQQRCADFIALCSPENIRTLLDELDRVEKARDFEQSSRLTSEAQLGTIISNLQARLAGVEKERDEAREHIRKQAADIMLLGRLVYAAPAECNSDCEDPECPYVHHPQTWQERAEAIEAAKNGLIEQAVRALEPFDSVVDAYNYFLPVMMPELNFPVEGTRAADPGFERVLSEADFRIARSTLSLLKASRPQNREETDG